MKKPAKKIEIVYEMTNNPHFGALVEDYNQKRSEYVTPSEIDGMCKSFIRLGYQYVLIDGAEELLRIKDNHTHLHLIFNKSIGFKGLERKITVPAIALMYRMPLMGTSAYPMTLARHKYHTNRLLAGMGFRVPFAYYFEELSQLITPKSYPVIVKPNAESDALGITDQSVCHDFDQLKKKAAELFENFAQPIIVEQYIPGPEWKVAVIGNRIHSKAYGCVNTLKNGHSMHNTLQTRDDLLKHTLTYNEPVEVQQVKQALHISELIHYLFGLSDYSRCDFRLDTNGDLYCMEVSTHPYLAEQGSSFIEAAKQNVHTFDEVIGEIIYAAEKRYYSTR
ncbi:MAG: hypothetical protein LUD02_05525 [Tannerellaceae bacterium]|nr:hypothetical protein [Tannerellaceae bacterium]MCD8263673.1 hypothetical protein [Tannerellaceae bacterium]